MPDYFTAMDGHGELCLWTGRNDDRPTCVLRCSDVTNGHWPDVVARMTGTTIHNNVDRQALVYAANVAYWHALKDGTATPMLSAVDAILAALTGAT